LLYRGFEQDTTAQRYVNGFSGMDLRWGKLHEACRRIFAKSNPESNLSGKCHPTSGGASAGFENADPMLSATQAERNNLLRLCRSETRMLIELTLHLTGMLG